MSIVDDAMKQRVNIFESIVKGQNNYFLNIDIAANERSLV